MWYYPDRSRTDRLSIRIGYIPSCCQNYHYPDNISIPHLPCFGHAALGPLIRADGVALLPPGVPHANDPGDELEDAVGGGEHAARE